MLVPYVSSAAKSKLPLDDLSDDEKLFLFRKTNAGNSLAQEMTINDIPRLWQAGKTFPGDCYNLLKNVQTLVIENPEHFGFADKYHATQTLLDDSNTVAWYRANATRVQTCLDEANNQLESFKAAKNLAQDRELAQKLDHELNDSLRRKIIDNDNPTRTQSFTRTTAPATRTIDKSSKAAKPKGMVTLPVPFTPAFLSLSNTPNAPKKVTVPFFMKNGTVKMGNMFPENDFHNNEKLGTISDKLDYYHMFRPFTVYWSTGEKRAYYHLDGMREYINSSAHIEPFDDESMGKMSISDLRNLRKNGMW